MLRHQSLGVFLLRDTFLSVSECVIMELDSVPNLIEEEPEK